MPERLLRFAHEWWPALIAFASTAAIGVLIVATPPDRTSAVAAFVMLIGVAAASWSLCVFKAVAGPRISELRATGQVLLGTPIGLAAMLAVTLLGARVGSPLTFGLITAVALGVILVAWPEKAR